MEAKKLNQTQRSNKLLLLIGVSTALLLVTPILILLGVGLFLDTHFHTSPVFTVGGVVMGSVGGIMNVFKLLQAAQKSKK